MPLYDYFCRECQAIQGVIKKVAQLDEPESCICCGRPMQRVLRAAMVAPDYPGYECPITGVWIEGRRAHVENLKKHGCRLLEKGEREMSLASKEQDEQALLTQMGDALEQEILRLPARKREMLAGELEAGAEAPVVRK